MSAIEFWHNNIGQFLSDLPVKKSDGAVIPQRTLKGIQSMRLGNIDAFYIATEENSKLIGRIELPNTDRLTQVPTEKYSARRFIAGWLIHEAKGPFMVGVIGVANASSSMRITYHPSKSYFCQAGSGFEFDLEKIKKALELISDYSWKKEIAPAIHLHNNWMHANQNDRPFLQKKLNVLLQKTPSLRTILSTIDIRPGSGEYQIISWYNIETNK